MDQEPLVIEEIQGGKKFVDEFDKYVPVQAAFWLRSDEDSGWYLYIASDQITDPKCSGSPRQSVTQILIRSE